jgi:two-component system response regulator RegX3
VQTGRRAILLVEDEDSISTPLVEALSREGFDVAVAPTVRDALASAEASKPDLVLLDLMLPDGSGLDVCRQLRSSSRIPIIMLTARGDEADRVVGLELGADDYVVKPFSARELTARIRAVLRRTEEAASPPAEELRVRGIRLQPTSRTASLDGAPLELSRKEFDLLQLLMENAGRVVTREKLIEDVWDTTWFGSTKTLDVHVSTLRRKLGDDSSEPRFIHTARGLGFRFAADEDGTA